MEEEDRETMKIEWGEVKVIEIYMVKEEDRKRGKERNKEINNGREG